MRGRGLGAVAVAAALLVAGCGDDDDDEATTATTEAPADDATPTTAAAGDGGGDAATVEVTLVDYAFEGLPDEVADGTTLTVTNESTEEIHELVAFRLPDGEERSSEELVGLPEEELGALFSGDPTTVLIGPPAGAPQIPAVGDGSLSPGGRFLLICTIPTGADPEEFLAAAQTSDGPPEVAGGAPHFVEGMHAILTVG